MKRSIVFLFMSISPIIALAQTTFLTEKVDTINPLQSGDFGQNLKNYASIYMGVGIPINTTNDGYEKVKGSNIEFGAIYKRKLGRTFSFLLDANWQRMRLNEKPLWPTTTETTIFYKKNVFNQMNLSSGCRINFDANRGNVLGIFMDVKAVGIYFLSASQRTKYLYTDIQQIEYKKSKPKPYNNRITVGLQGTIGKGRSAVTCTYLKQITLSHSVADLSNIPFSLTYRFNFM